MLHLALGHKNVGWTPTQERKISPKRKFWGRITRGHPGVIRADIPAQNFGQGSRNPGKTSIWAWISMTRRRGRPRPWGISKNFGQKNFGLNFRSLPTHRWQECRVSSLVCLSKYLRVQRDCGELEQCAWSRRLGEQEVLVVVKLLEVAPFQGCLFWRFLLVTTGVLRRLTSSRWCASSSLVAAPAPTAVVRSEKKQPKHKVFGQDLPGTSGIQTSGYPGQKLSASGLFLLF